MTGHGFRYYLVSILYAVIGCLLIGICEASAVGGGIAWLLFSAVFLWDALATVPAWARDGQGEMFEGAA